MTDSVIETTVTGLLVTESAEGTIVTETTETHVLETSTGGGSGATALIVQEGDTTVVAAADTVDFAAADFDVTVSPSGEANVALATGHTGSTHAAVQAAAEATAAAALTAHEGASDPHPGYTTSAELTSALAGYQPLDSDLTAIAALTTTSFGRALLALADAAALRTAAGLGTAATQSTAAFDAAGSAAAAQAASQPLDSDLTAIAALSTTSFGRAFLALADAAAARTAIDFDEAARDVIGSALTEGDNITLEIDDALNTLTVHARLPTFGGLVSVGDSYTQLGGGNDSTSSFGPADSFSNFTRKVAAYLRIPPDEVFLLGKSGAAASCPDDGSTSGVPQGVGVVLKHIQPNHIYSGQITPPAYSDYGTSWPGLFMLTYGYNDLGPENLIAEFDNAGKAAFVHGLRTMISRMRAKSLHLYNDSAIAYGGSGAWADNTRATYSTRGTMKRNATSGGTITFTIPTTFTGGTVAFVFLGGAGGHTTTTGTGSSSTSLAVADRSDFPQSGNFDITIDGTAATVSGGHGTGAGTFTLTAAKTWSSGATVLRARAGKVDWSGTATGATGSTTLSGQGRSGREIQVTKRFTGLTRADAGKTIIATSASLGTNEYCEFDSVHIEDPEPPIALVLGLPFGPFSSTSTDTHTPAQVDALNTATSALVDEFDASVVFVDLETQFEKWFGATLNGAVTVGQTSIPITVADAAECRIGKGSVLRSFGTAYPNIENMLVTDVTSQVGTAWTVTVTRNYSGSTGGDQAHNNGEAIRDVRWIRPDNVHPSIYGHRLYSERIISALLGVNQSSAQVANAGAYVARRDPGVRNGTYLFTVGGGRNAGTAAAFTQEVEYCTPFYLPALATLTEIGYWVQTLRAAAGGTNGVARLGIRLDSGNGTPGSLLLDAGVTSSDITTTGLKSITGLWQPMKPGWYWGVFVGQQVSQVTGGTQWNSTVKIVTHSPLTASNYGTVSPYLSLGRDSLGSLADFRDPPQGYSYSRTAKFPAALDSMFMNPFSSGAASAQITEAPALAMKFVAPVRD